jgi:hypothetical protein
MNGFSVSSQLTLSDWNAYQAACWRRSRATGLLRAAVTVGAPIAMAILAFGLMQLAHASAERTWLMIGVLIGYGSLVVGSRLVRFGMKPVRDGAFLGDCTFDFSPIGICVRRPQVESTTSWGAVREFTSTPDHLFIWIDTIAAFVVPARDLPAGLSTKAAQATLEDLKAQACADTDRLSTETTAPPAIAPSMERPPYLPRSLARSMKAGMKWLLWRPFEGRALDAPDLAIALLGLLSVALIIGLDRIGVGPKAEFNYFAAQVLACKTLGLLGIGWLIWRTTDPQASWRSVLFVLAGLSLLAVLARSGIDHFMVGRSGLVATWAFFTVQTVYLARALKVATGYRQLRATLISAGVLVICGPLVSQYLAVGPLWYEPQGEEASNYERSRHEAERLLMSQPGRIDAAVAAMAPRSDSTNAYMVGFAGVGEQKVFAGEIALAAKVFGERYGTQRRTLLLVNDQRDLESRPLASVTALRLALADIGKRMDREHDVLILVISSHGSSEPLISVSNGGIPLGDLTGKDLKEALDQAGIRWRVVIISACHAGAFIPYLRDERSIVITAAAADRTSFGCSNDRDLTNFGEAFIRDALPGSSSIRAAFETAQASIAAREHAEGLTPSMPTAYFGAGMESRLEELQGSIESPQLYSVSQPR